MITLVSKRYAEVGRTFIFNGLSEECVDCKYYKVCGALEKGRKYEIQEVRDVEHSCKITGEKVKVVKVIPAAIKTAVKLRAGVLGSIITYEPVNCNLRCDFKSYCFPEGLKKNDKCRVEKLCEEEFLCKAGRDLRLFFLRPLL